MSDSTPTLERDHHMGILRQWGTATPMWALEYIEQLEAAGNDERENTRLHLAINDAIHWLSRDWPEEADRILRAAIARTQEQSE